MAAPPHRQATPGRHSCGEQEDGGGDDGEDELAPEAAGERGGRGASSHVIWVLHCKLRCWRLDVEGGSEGRAGRREGARPLGIG